MSGNISEGHSSIQAAWWHHLWSIVSPYVLSEIKPYLKTGSVNDEALILSVTKTEPAGRGREDSFLSNSKKVKGATASAVEPG